MSVRPPERLSFGKPSATDTPTNRNMMKRELAATPNRVPPTNAGRAGVTRLREPEPSPDR